jgi:hypothetical protein
MVEYEKKGLVAVVAGLLYLIQALSNFKFGIGKNGKSRPSWLYLQNPFFINEWIQS